INPACMIFICLLLWNWRSEAAARRSPPVVRRGRQAAWRIVSESRGYVARTVRSAACGDGAAHENRVTGQTRWRGEIPMPRRAASSGEGRSGLAGGDVETGDVVAHLR